MWRTWLVCASSVVLAFGQAHAKTLLLPVEAIEDSRYLKAEDYRALYPGIDISGQIPDEEGWYVRYRHENLTYYYGPLSDRFQAAPHLRELKEIHTPASKKRPRLESAEMTLFERSYLVEPESGGGPSGAQDNGAPGGVVEPEDPTGAGPEGQSGENTAGNARAPEREAGGEEPGEDAAGAGTGNEDRAAAETRSDEQEVERPPRLPAGTPTPQRKRTISLVDVLFRAFGF